MKYLILLVVLSIGLCSGSKCSEGDISNGVEARLKFSVSNQHKNKLSLLELEIKNQTQKKIYLNDLKPPIITLYRKNEDGVFEDYTDVWLQLSLDLISKDTALDYSEIRVTTNKVFDVLKHQFIEPNALKYYQNVLKEKAKYIRNGTDTIGVVTWVRKEFESILYLNQGEVYRSLKEISSLPPGAYKVFFSFSNLEEKKNYFPREFYESLNLALPENLNGYKQWKGAIKSDTLYLNIR